MPALPGFETVSKELLMRLSITRRKFLRHLAGGAAIMAAPQLSLAREEKIGKKTFTYKKIDTCEIKADVYQSPGQGAQPVVVWIHGGALIMGNRGQGDRTLL